MKRLLMTAFLGFATTLFSVASKAGEAAGVRGGSPLPAQQGMINLSLLDALVAVHAEDLAGVFGYISDSNAAPAFADYLFRNPKALKEFIKKDERDLRRANGVNEWDKEVYLYLVTINSNASITGAQELSAKLFDHVTTLSLAPGVSLAEIKIRKRQ